MLVKDFIKSKYFDRLPSTIVQHSVFEHIKEINKIFPSLGLENNREYYNDTYDIGFSSSDEKGLWDIATMSMRGVRSCMRWGSKHHTHLVGSIIDPFCGIIYLTNRKRNKYGCLFKKRAVVRFVAHYVRTCKIETKRDAWGTYSYKKYSPFLFKDFGLYIERVYSDNGPNKDNHCDKQNKVINIFSDYLVEKISNKTLDIYSNYKLISRHDYDLNFFKRPTFTGNKFLTPGYKSLTDARLPYKNISNKMINNFIKQ